MKSNNSYFLTDYLYVIFRGMATLNTSKLPKVKGREGALGPTLNLKTTLQRGLPHYLATWLYKRDM